MPNRTVAICLILGFATGSALASELEGLYVMKQADIELNTKMNDYMRCIHSERNGMRVAANGRKQCAPELEAALQSAPKELRTKVSNDLLGADLPLTARNPHARAHEDLATLSTLKDAPPNALASQAVEDYFDCVANHSAFLTELEAAQAGCFEARSHIGALLSEDDAAAVTATIDSMLMARWRNDSARAGVQK